jgi:hypothetical protein
LNYNNIQIQFDSLSDKQVDFLMKIIKKAECLRCKKQASYDPEKNRELVYNICCEDFSNTIGRSLNIRTITNTAGKLRGDIIQIYCDLENFVDIIIEIQLKKHPDTFKDIFQTEEFPIELQMRERKKGFQKALNIYSENSGVNSEKIWGPQLAQVLSEAHLCLNIFSSLRT